MQWDEPVEEFRAIGGVADNVRLGIGPRGRRLFVVDPGKPASLRKYDGRLVRELQETSINQLEALSSCVAARAL